MNSTLSPPLPLLPYNPHTLFIMGLGVFASFLWILRSCHVERLSGAIHGRVYLGFLSPQIQDLSGRKCFSTHIRSHIRPDCNDLILHFFLESPPKSSLQFIFNPHGVLAPPQTHCPCFLHHCLHLRYWGYCSAVPYSIL